MATEYTPNYNLDLYAGTDKPNLRDQYNAAMGKIDKQMKANADGVTNANANVAAMQTQVTQNKEDIAALESTVETHTTQIAAVQETAGDALSLAQTNETGISSVKTDVEQLNTQMGTASSNIDSLQSTTAGLDSQIDSLNTEVDKKAPTDHSSTATTFGVGSGSEYGHVKLSDTASASDVADGTAATPKAVQDSVQVAVQGIESANTPKLFEFGKHASGNVYGTLCVNEATHLCVLRVSFWNFTPTGASGALSAPVYTVPEEYRPTATFGQLADVNFDTGSGMVSSVTSLRFMNEGGGSGASDGRVCYVQYYRGSATAVSGEATLVWYYGAQKQ